MSAYPKQHNYPLGNGRVDNMYAAGSGLAPPSGVGQSSTFNGDTIPVAVTQQPQRTYAVDGGAPAQQGELPIRQRPTPGKWSDGICSWPNNIWPSCCCTLCCCHSVYIQAQMAEKTGYTKFSHIIIAYAVIMFITFIFSLIFIDAMPVSWVSFFFALFLGISLRLHLIRVYGITECSNTNHNANVCGECLYGLCCFPCSICQMARHVYGYHFVLDGDARIDRKDQYDLPIEGESPYAQQNQVWRNNQHQSYSV